MRRAVFLVLLLALALMPTVSATGGVIQSVTVTGDGEIGSGPIDVNLTLNGTAGSSSASVNWSITLSTMEGNLIDSDSGNSLVSDGVLVYVESTLGDAPLGYSNLTIDLTGDVGTPGNEQSVSWSQIIHRLRPLDISLGNILFTGVNSSGDETGNITVNDGDHARIDIPVVNDGDVVWNGSVDLSLQGQTHTLDADVAPDSSLTLSFQTGVMSEGEYAVSAALNGTTDSDVSDDISNSTLVVGPPPLPLISLELNMTNSAEIGQTMEWSLTAENTGSALFDGNLTCDFDGDLVLDESHQIATNSNSSTTVSLNSKPGTLTCTTSLARTSVTNNAVDVVDIESAVFLGAGHSSPSLLQGPWHVGDEVLLSMLIRNEGDASGTATMQVEIDGVEQLGSSITLDSNKAGEVHQELTFSQPGDHIVNWSIVSDDGAIDANLSGSLVIPILAAQVIVLDIESVTHVSNGVQIDWTVSLSEGRSRTVVLTHGSIKDGIRNDGLVEERVLLPGITTSSIVLGGADGQQVYSTIELLGWTMGFGSDYDEVESVPEFSPEPEIVVSPNTQPAKPTAGEQTTVFYTIANSGSGVVSSGEVLITDSDGVVLARKSSQELETSQDQSVVVTWPEGESVTIRAVWTVDEVTVTDQVSIASEPVTIESESFSIPWGGILGGLVLGMLLIFVVRIRNSPKDEKKKKPKKESKSSASSDEKVEVACPTCERRLRVPRTYTGGVRCPECETKFDVEGKQDTPEPENTKDEDEDGKEGSDDQLWSSSSDDILGCPKCARKLKVPYDRRPAKARCPACEVVFEARKA